MLRLNPFEDDSMQRFPQYVAEQEELETLRESYNIDKEDYKTIDCKTQCIIKTEQGISAVGEVPTSNRDYYLSFKAAIVNLKETLDKLDAANARHDFMTESEIEDEHQRLKEAHKIIDVSYDFVQTPASSIQLVRCLITTETGKQCEGRAMGFVHKEMKRRSFENAIIELEKRNKAIDMLDKSVTVHDKKEDGEYQQLLDTHQIVNDECVITKNDETGYHMLRCLFTTECGKQVMGVGMAANAKDSYNVVRKRALKNAIKELERINKESKENMVKETQNDEPQNDEPQNEDRTLSPLEIKEMNDMRQKWRISGEEYYEKGEEVLCVINLPYGDIKQVVGNGATEKEAFYDAIAIMETVGRVVSTDNKANKQGNIATEIAPYDVVEEQFIHMGDNATACLLKTRCGYEATGIAYCYDPKVFDKSIGCNESRKDAMVNLQDFVAYFQKHDDDNKRMDSRRTIYQTFEDSTITACCLIDEKGIAAVGFSDSKSSNPSEVITRMECLLSSYEQHYYRSKHA